MATGMNRETGGVLSGKAHMEQSVVDILTTPLGSRIMNREYGSNLFRLIDSPTNEAGVIDITNAVASALTKWEPRISLTSVNVYTVDQGKITLSLKGAYKPDGSSISIEGVDVS